jgi:hypothetical protein
LSTKDIIVEDIEALFGRMAFLGDVLVCKSRTTKTLPTNTTPPNRPQILPTVEIVSTGYNPWSVYEENIYVGRNLTSAQILPTVEIVSTGYNPRRVSAPRRMASLPVQNNWDSC